MTRIATKDEWTQIADLTKAAYGEFAKDADPDFWSMYESRTRDLLLNDESLIRFIVLDGDVIAASAIYVPPNKNKYPEMRLLSVHPDYRNKGLANKLIEACECRAKDDGFDFMTLHTTSLMTTAKAMYERRGYERFEELDFKPVPTFTVWGYIKKL
ncbi:GNAT family N-acetyltransferase [bacterium]|nr:GNAT family N-acetyltransferase [bacterium]